MKIFNLSRTSRDQELGPLLGVGSINKAHASNPPAAYMRARRERGVKICGLFLYHTLQPEH